MGLLLALEDDVEDGMETVFAREDAPELPLCDRKRMRRLAVPVENARDESRYGTSPAA
jgi:hypothetical protein